MFVPPILCYHKIDERLELGFTQLEPRVFRRQVETLARRGYRGIGSEELIETVRRSDGQTASGYRSGGHQLEADDRRLVFTFDDGYAALAERAFPVLADHGFAALVFVVSDYVGRENAWDVQYGWRRFRHLDWDQLGHWQERGVEVHSHGATHARLTWLGDDAVMDELCRSREAIANRLGRAPAAVSYPFGATDRRVCALAARAGYGLGFAGPGAKGDDMLTLPRLPVYGWDGFAVPLVMRAGALGALGRAVARLTSRCAVGTAVFQRLLGARYR